MIIAFSGLYSTFHVHFYLASCLNQRAEIQEDGREEHFRSHLDDLIIDKRFGSMTYFRVLSRIRQRENSRDLGIQMLHVLDLQCRTDLSLLLQLLGKGTLIPLSITSNFSDGYYACGMLSFTNSYSSLTSGSIIIFYHILSGQGVAAFSLHQYIFT